MSRLFHVLTIISMVIGTIGALGMYISALVTSFGLGLLGTLLSAVYFAIFIYLFSRLPFWPRKRTGESRTWLYAALLWGGGVSVIMTLPMGLPLMEIFAYTESRASVASWGGAYPEEIVKTLGVLVICLAFTQLSRPWHAMIVGGMIGLGFEVIENVLYGAVGAQMHQDSDWAGFWETWGLRVLAGPGLHVMCTAIAGWGIGWALFAAYKSRMWRLGTACGWWLVAFAIHWAWNYDLVDNTPMVIKIVIIMIVMYYVFARICLRSNALYKADLGQSYLPRPLPTAEETPRPVPVGHRLPLGPAQEHPQPQSK